jgi:hypothetical protein
VKQQLTSADTVLFQLLYARREAGDIFQYYDPADASPTLRVREEQEPIIVTGWHHEWSAGHRTLFLGRYCRIGCD